MLSRKAHVRRARKGLLHVPAHLRLSHPQTVMIQKAQVSSITFYLNRAHMKKNRGCSDTSQKLAREEVTRASLLGMAQATLNGKPSTWLKVDLSSLPFGIEKPGD